MMFIYVMDTASRDKLISLGYELVKDNGKNTLWVFVNKPNMSFDRDDIPCIVSDTLTF